MHISCDFGFHKLIIVPPSRPTNSSSMATKISGLTPLHQTTLLKSDQHKESSFLTGLGHGSYSLSPFGIGMDMVMGLPSHFFISNMSCLLPVVFELLCISLLREQYQNSLFPVEWRAGMGWRCLNNLKIASWLLLSRWRRWHAAIPLFFSKIRYGVGSTSSRHAASFSFWLPGAHGWAVLSYSSAGLIGIWVPAIFLNESNNIWTH